MKYKVGDRVRIKSLDWYNKNRDEFDEVPCKGITFVTSMTQYCDSILTIENKTGDSYQVKENTFWWTDDMIEGLVEEETESDKVIEEAKTFWDSIKDAWICPEGYIFKDENGNVINATKIVLEKKKKEYPKTFLECCDVLNIGNLIERGVKGYKAELFDTLQKLYICRDAYWKIAGEEMGLGKPWEPDSEDYTYVIARKNNSIILYESSGENEIFEFPTKEMRDAFKENFDKDLEVCKELL